MMMDVLREEDDRLDWGEELAGDVERGRDDAETDDPGEDEPLLGEEKEEEEVVRGVEESVSEAEE